MGFEERLQLLESSGQISSKAVDITEDILTFFEEELGLAGEAEEMQMFATHVALAVERVLRGEPFDDETVSQSVAEARSKFEYRIALNLAERLKDKHNITIPEIEVAFIAAHLYVALRKAMEGSDLVSTPLSTMTVDEAKRWQFRLVDIMSRNLTGYEALQDGDYGVVVGKGRPNRTAEVETMLAEFFEGDDACLVRGAGSGAIRAICTAVLSPGDKVLVHDAPMYTTTQVTFKALGADVVPVDMNDLNAVRAAVTPDIKSVWLQRSRQKMTDNYDAAEVIKTVRNVSDKPVIVVDENYAVLKAHHLGVYYGADISTCSMFKLFGPPGIGCVVGKSEIIDEIRRQNYSGGGQVQGPEAMEVIRSLVLVPVIFAVQGEVVKEVTERLNGGEVEGIVRAVHANLEERVILIQFAEPIARQVLLEAEKLGALPHPVGSDSRYEVHPLFYRVARTMLDYNPVLGSFVIRVNPMRAGADSVIRILKEAMERTRNGVSSCS